jgi:hypothetical protein
MLRFEPKVVVETILDARLSKRPRQNHGDHFGVASSMVEELHG